METGWFGWDGGFLYIGKRAGWRVDIFYRKEVALCGFPLCASKILPGLIIRRSILSPISGESPSIRHPSGIACSRNSAARSGSSGAGGFRQSAFQKFQQLADVFQQDGPGLLVHPVWKTERAYFASLQLSEVPAPDFVRYKFEFWEDWNGYDSGLHEIPVQSETPAPSQNSGGQKNICVVRKGDTLWGIAKRYGVELTKWFLQIPRSKTQT